MGTGKIKKNLSHITDDTEHILWTYINAGNSKTFSVSHNTRAMMLTFGAETGTMGFYSVSGYGSSVPLQTGIEASALTITKNDSEHTITLSASKGMRVFFFFVGNKITEKS